MKFNKFKHHSILKIALMSGVTLMLSVAIATTTSATPRHNTFRASTNSSLIAQSPLRIASSGTFVAAEAPTTGTAQIVESEGQRYLVLDSAFSTTDQAPDLHVVLERANVPPDHYSNFGTFVNLGALQNVKGEQRYPIPDAVNLAQFRSVSIWCRMANATMGYATLQGIRETGAQ